MKYDWAHFKAQVNLDLTFTHWLALKERPEMTEIKVNCKNAKWQVYADSWKFPKMSNLTSL